MTRGMALLGWLIGLPLGLALALFLFWRLWFLRDPEREIPGGDAIVSPADGRVLAVENVELPGSGRKGAGRFNFSCSEVGKSATLVSIFMSPLDVHINRAPIAGTIAAVRYHKGEFHHAGRKDAVMNESNEIVIRGERHTIGVVQVAGVLARRIRCFVREGQRVGKGERIGLINLGSRVCLLLPAGISPKARPGDRVRAGSSVVAEVAP